MSNDVTAALEGIYTLLSGDVALTTALGTDVSGNPRIYPEVAPQESDFPVVTYSAVPIADNLIVGATRVLARIMFRVVGVVRGADYATLKTIADRIEAVLHDSQGTYAGQYVTIHREAPISFASDESGELFYYLGGQYRVEVHPS